MHPTRMQRILPAAIGIALLVQCSSFLLIECSNWPWCQSAEFGPELQPGHVQAASVLTAGAAEQAGSAAPCVAPPPRTWQRYAFDSRHMGTLFRIVVYATDATQAQQAAQAAFNRIAALDACMSDYQSSSELLRLCQAYAETTSGPAVRVSDDLFRVLATAEQLSRRSQGAFDVTVGPLSLLWRHARRTQELPDPAALAAARARVGYDKVRLDPLWQTVHLTVPGMRLDLGGIAKGYAADEALRLLRDNFGLPHALVAAWGDIVCGDPPPGETAWRIQIAPIAASHKPRYIRLARAAVSTSGDLEQFVVINGVRYSHVLDPRTGLGLTGRRSVTVIAPRGIEADSLTKAVSVLPLPQALQLIADTPGTAAYIAVLDEKTGQVHEVRSPRFADYEERAD
ncbi:MAG: FAD:protein FMN transferase [Thermogemmata sp.]|nr:FAD:protein FMN transferase [Thermogemmata sp.]